MAHDRDVDAFDRRAAGYDSGWRGRLHHDITARTLDIALGAVPQPHAVLDVGCGTGLALQAIAARVPGTTGLVGIDPAPGMVEAARAAADDDRIEIRLASIESLAVPPASFDLIIASTSFDHWADQSKGLRRRADDAGRPPRPCPHPTSG